MIPNGFKMAPTHLARYSLKLYNVEMMRHLFDGNIKKLLSIGFGEAPEVFNYLCYLTKEINKLNYNYVLISRVLC